VHVARVGEGRKLCKVLGKPKGKRPLGRPSCRWENRIIMDIKEIDWQGVKADLPSSG
jgi:hypothetical protein